MVHRLALLMGGAGAAGVLALALALGGFGAPLPSSPDAFVPLANDSTGGGQAAPAAAAPAAQPTAQPTDVSLGGGDQQGANTKVIDTVYVLPAPTAQAGDSPRHPRNDGGNNNAGNNNGGNTAGDDQSGSDSANDDNSNEQSGDDSANSDDQSSSGDHSDDGGGDDGGHEPGDD